MQELQYYSAQIEPGFISASVDVSLHVRIFDLSCTSKTADYHFHYLRCPKQFIVNFMLCNCTCSYIFKYLAKTVNT